MIQLDDHIFQMGWFNHQLDDVFFPADQHPRSVDGLGWYFLVVSTPTSPLKGSNRTYLGRHVAGGTSPGLNLILAGGFFQGVPGRPEEQTWLLLEGGFFNQSRVLRWGRFFFFRGLRVFKHTFCMVLQESGKQ